jgi:hypothetical protein
MEQKGRKNARNAEALIFVAQKKLAKAKTFKLAGGIYENMFAGS